MTIDQRMKIKYAQYGGLEFDLNHMDDRQAKEIGETILFDAATQRMIVQKTIDFSKQCNGCGAPSFSKSIKCEYCGVLK